MATDFGPAFESLKALLQPYADRFALLADKPEEYTLATKSAPKTAPHKGKPLWFGSVRKGKAYVSYHLMPLYTSPELAGRVSPELKKRMQGKQCFNFRSVPEAELLTELEELTEAGFGNYSENGWL